MKALRFPLFTILLAVAVGLPMAVSAKPRGGQQAKQKPYVPIHTTISAVSDTSITTSTNSSDAKHEAKTVTYSITASTEIEVKGQRATAKDLKEGMRVTVTVGDGPTIAARISASDAPHDPQKTGKKQ